LILVVDDEVGIRNVARMMLEAHGYRVVTAANGKEALAAYAERPGEVRAVLTDMMMPVMDGPATIRALRELDPALPVLAFSGLADTFRADDPALAGVRAIVRKPLSGADLLATLAGVLQ
jgi:CheY-like chemotaxis protein